MTSGPYVSGREQGPPSSVQRKLLPEVASAAAQPGQGALCLRDETSSILQVYVRCRILYPDLPKFPLSRNKTILVMLP